MNILGLHSGHDASVAILKDGQVAAAISEERLSRIKCDSDDLPLLSLEEIYRYTDISPKDINFLSLLMTFMPEEYFIRETLYKELERRWVRARRRLKAYLKGETFKSVLLVANLAEKLKKREKDLEDHFRWEKFRKDFGFDTIKWRFCDHHLAHAWPAVYFSNWDEALVVTIDGMGDDRIFHTTSVFRDGKLRRVAVSRGAAASVGLFYCDITKLLGYKPLRHEGKITGLSAYGDPSKLLDSMKPCLRLFPDKMTFVSDFSEKGGESERFRYLKKLIRSHEPSDVAAAGQQLVEEVVVSHVQAALRRYRLSRVALSGGLFANVKLNHEIAELDEVEEVFVFPAMGDTGNAVGTALFGMYHNDQERLWEVRARLDDVYWGSSYDEYEIEKILKESGVSYRRYVFEDLAGKVANLIHSGRVVGCFQGRMEFGPRALGNRSILAAPTDRTINDWLNKRLDRTEFMPFAPSVLAPYADDIFKNYSKGAYTSKFMTIIFEVYEKWRSKIPAVVHVDGTARPQVVAREDNPRYYDLIEAYYKLSGIPLILNTSFNVHEEPIICKPVEAIRALKDKRIDALMIENFLAVT
ncbi:MAG: hypothetical protein DRH17_06390 [Deltaproteobacteria bacterium]|nr:MAG: hypothetical protein DRH17_06390 [Deltaproteobacteria bacterium]